MYSKTTLDGLVNHDRETDMESIFDEKAKRLTHLEEVFKRSAANYDEKVPK
jgi:hypothetical protein